MQSVVIVVLVILLLGLIAMLRLSHKKRVNQNSYAIFLLLNDEIRQDHTLKFVSFLQERADEGIDSLHLSAGTAVEAMADNLAANSSILAARTLISNAAQNPSKRSAG